MIRSSNAASDPAAWPDRSSAPGPAVSLVPWAELNPQPVLVFNPDAQLVYFNQAASRLAATLGFQQPGWFLPPEAGAAIRTCLSTSQAYPPFYTHTKGHALCWSFFPVAGLNLVQCQVTDVTERQWVEQRLRHAQKLEAMGRVAAAVAHDFNNALTVIQGHTGLLRADPRLTPDMAESLKSIARAAERASALTKQLLTLSRKSVGVPQRLNLNEWLNTLSPLLHRTVGEDVEVQFDLEPTLPEVEVDPGLIQQALLNLMVQARDTMPQGGTLLIRTTFRQVEPAEATRHPHARPGRFVCLTLADTGIGLPASALEHLFEPFFSQNPSDKDTDLSLAIAYSIVRQHHGWIEAHSQLGQGTTLQVFLPAADPLQQPTGPKADAACSSPTSQGTETILVVEDEPAVRWTVRTILQRYGYRVLEACSGVEALALWHQHHRQISLVLTDIVLPAGVSGPELVEKLRHQKPELKVIFTSGYSRETAAPELDLIEGLTFLRKPFEAQKLVWAVRSCLDGWLQPPSLPPANSSTPAQPP